MEPQASQRGYGKAVKGSDGARQRAAVRATSRLEVSYLPAVCVEGGSLPCRSRWRPERAAPFYRVVIP